MLKINNQNINYTNNMISQQNQTIYKTTINDFEIISELGKGSFGYVYKVRRYSDYKIYALKKVSFSKLNPKEKENSLNEIRILASISNKNIIEYKESFYDNDNNCLCLVMEFADNGDLEKKIQHRAKSKYYYQEYEILSMLIQITKGLKALHDNNIMHRDIKSANIFMFQNDIVKIGDLNVSKILKNGLHNTQTGTPYYASPEVWDNNLYDFKSDIWSLGCLLYEMCALKAPFRGNTMKMVYDKVKQGIYEPIPNVYSKSLSGLIYICLQTNPIYRPTCAQLLSLIKDKVSLFNLDGKCLDLFDEDIDRDLMTNNIYSEKICNRMKNNEEEKCELLDTIKMPKRLIEINSVLPRNRYASSASKRIQKSLLNYKGRLPKLNMIDLKIINTGGNREKRKDSKNCMLKQNNSEANILTMNYMNKKEKRDKLFDWLDEKEKIDQIKRRINSPSPKIVNDIIYIKNKDNSANTLIPKSNSQKKLESTNANNNETKTIDVMNDKMFLDVHNLNFNKLQDIFSHNHNSSLNIRHITPYSKKNKLKAILSPKALEPLQIKRAHSPDGPIAINHLNDVQEDNTKINKIICNIPQIDTKNTDSKLPSRIHPSLQYPPHFERKEIPIKNHSRAISAMIPRINPTMKTESKSTEPMVQEIKKRVSRYFRVNKDNTALNISALPTIEKSDLYTQPNKCNHYNQCNIQKERIIIPKRLNNVPSCSKYYKDSIFNNYKSNAYPIRVSPHYKRESNNKTNCEQRGSSILNLYKMKEDNSVYLENILKGYRVNSEL